MARGNIKPEMGFLRDIISVVVSNAPVERLFDRSPRLKHLQELRDQLPSAEEQQVTPAPMESPTEEVVEEKETSIGVTDSQTLAYQLDRLIDDILHLETEHLPNQGRIAGLPCDCIAKASRELRRHARETIPIAARQGKEAEIYSAAASWAERMMEIGSLEAVESGQHDQEYLREAGTASNFRKEFERLYSELKSEKSQISEKKSEKSEQPCPECATLEELRSWLDKRRTERG